MKSNGSTKSQLNGLSSLLDTEIGRAMVSMMIGLGLNYAPSISEDARVQRLSESFRVSGMATAGNAVMSEALDKFMPIIKQALSTLPEEKVRVNDPIESIEEELLDEIETSAKTKA